MKDTEIEALLARTRRKVIGPEKAVLRKVIERDRAHPITAVELARECKSTQREVTIAIQGLRQRHGIPIGASRDAPTGYFLIRCAADEEVAIRPYLAQVETMLRTIRKFTSPETRRLVRSRLENLLTLFK